MPRNVLRVLLSMIMLLTAAFLKGDGRTPFPATGRLTFQNFSVGDGLSHSSVRQILQDHTGYMWFATAMGLDRYNGYAVETYRHQPGTAGSLSTDTTTCLLEDSKKNLWVGTLYGLNRLNRETGTFTFYGYDPDNSSGISGFLVRHICEDRRGMLWISMGRRGLNRLDPAGGTFTRFRHDPSKAGSLASDTVMFVFPDSEGALWVSTWDKGLSRFDESSGIFSPFPLDLPGTGGGRATCMVEDRDGNRWIGTWGAGVLRLDRDGKSIKRYDLAALTGEGQMGAKREMANRVNTLCPDRGGLLWIGTGGAGLAVLEPRSGQVRLIAPGSEDPSGLENGFIHTLYEDASGLLWIGGEGGGIDILDRGRLRFRRYRRRPGPISLLGSNNVTAVHEGRDKTLWVGTLDAGLDAIDPARETSRHYSYHPDNPKGIGSNGISALLEDGAGNLWIGTAGRGLDKLDRSTGTFSHYRRQQQPPRENNRENPGNGNSLGNDNVTDLLEDPPGTLWIAGHGGLNRLDTREERFTQYRRTPGDGGDPGDPDLPASNLLFCLCKGQSGGLWIGTNGSGLDRFDPREKKFRHYRFIPGDKESLSSNNIACIFQGWGGVLWVGTTRGLDKLAPKTGKVTRYGTAQGLRGPVVYGIMGDSRGYLWMSTNRGISRFHPITGTFRNYTGKSGLQKHGFTINAYCRGPGGEMYFGGRGGLNSFHPDRLRDNPHVPPLVFTALKLAYHPVEAGPGSVLKKPLNQVNSITLSHRDTIFSLEVAALDYTMPEKNRYRYRVQQLKGDWIDLGTGRRITFTGLNPGKYRLEVKGANSDGVWNHRGISMDIIITPPWWRRWWFLVLLTAAVAAAVYGWHRWRMKRLALELKTEGQLTHFFEKNKISNREQEILKLILKGKSNKEIEEELYISMSTVKAHIYNAYKKLGVQNRLELIHVIQKAEKNK